MKYVGKIALCLAGVFAVNAVVWADNSSSKNNPVPDNPYAPIVERNVFGLLPPPAPPDPSQVALSGLPKITLQGIYSVYGHSKAMFKVSGAATKVGQAPKDMYYDLAEGQREDDYEVVSIDADNGMVTFKNHDITEDIPLATVGASSSAPSPGPISGPIPGRPGFIPGPNNNYGSQGNGGFPRGGLNTPNFSGNNGSLNGNASGGTIGTASTGMNTGRVPGQPPTMSAEEQIAAMYVQRQQYINEGNGAALLYPPLPGDPDGPPAPP
jgi:hypothetical protein